MAIFGGNGFGGLLGSILGGGAMRSGIAPGDNDWLEEFRKRMGLPGGPVADTSVPAPQPQQRGGFLGGLFGGGGGNWGDRLSDIGQRLGAAGAYFDGDWQAGAAINQARAEQEAQRRQAMGAQGEQERIYADLIAEGYTPTQARLALLNAKSIGEAAVNKANPKPQEEGQFIRDMRAAGIAPESPQGQNLIRQRLATQALPPPSLVGDSSSGWTWQQPPAPSLPGMPGAQSGGSQTPVGTIEDGYQFMGGDDSDPKNWKPVGGGASNGIGGFPRRR